MFSTKGLLVFSILITLVAAALIVVQVMEHTSYSAYPSVWPAGSFKGI